MSFNVQSFLGTYNTVTYIHGAIPLAPLAGSPLLPFVSPSTYLAPSSCDRNRPPPSQVACKLTLFSPPFTQLCHPFQIPRTPTAQRLTMTTSGIFRLLLSGTSSPNQELDTYSSTMVIYPKRGELQQGVNSSFGILLGEGNVCWDKLRRALRKIIVINFWHVCIVIVFYLQVFFCFW